MDDIGTVREMVAACMMILEAENLPELHTTGRRIAKDAPLLGLPEECMQVVRAVYRTMQHHLKAETERARTVAVSDTPPF